MLRLGSGAALRLARRAPASRALAAAPAPGPARREGPPPAGFGALKDALETMAEMRVSGVLPAGANLATGLSVAHGANCLQALYGVGVPELLEGAKAALGTAYPLLVERRWGELEGMVAGPASSDVLSESGVGDVVGDESDVEGGSDESEGEEDDDDARLAALVLDAGVGLDELAPRDAGRRIQVRDLRLVASEVGEIEVGTSFLRVTTLHRLWEMRHMHAEAEAADADAEEAEAVQVWAGTRDVMATWVSEAGQLDWRLFRLAFPPTTVEDVDAMLAESAKLSPAPAAAPAEDASEGEASEEEAGEAGEAEQDKQK